MTKTILSNPYEALIVSDDSTLNWKKIVQSINTSLNFLNPESFRERVQAALKELKMQKIFGALSRVNEYNITYNPYKVCGNDTNMLFEEKSFAFGSNIRLGILEAENPLKTSKNQ
uniref:Uncharacterized protein n=1 Tax=Romanomermis culicivorax TaxID=13658 RepID=A0A915KKM4_ROMCU